ncbi:cytochrome P450 [Leucobacter rhizosphaerae]|uniref:Cytochrome P450 n=1 Tax=Leucobacter rhizosphaerae TaxID=2932245 RepID=A0ABY4FVG9_9MICO|nr:cytochrome P450 [Leucobacter rhizosphaerae]UOQ60303.1 cytochrome P450 [Leucobacter rhizosphaerae]
MAARPAPVADWVTIAELHRDPFPIYERLRAEGGVHWVPAVGRYLITSYAAVHETELDQEIYSANEEGSLQIRAMGHSMLRRDDPEHYVERRAWQPALRPGIVKRTWTGVFERNADRYLSELAEKGPGADLIWDFAAPYAAENLRQLLGLHNADQSDLQRWSQTMIDATGNYADDPEVWALGKASFDEVDIALDEMLAWHAAHLDDNPTLIAQLLRAPGETMPLERIRANMKMSIGGGLNEPRDAIGVAAWALLSHPEQRDAVLADAGLWPAVFEETIRWVAPIGLYSRQVTRDTELAGVHLPAGARLGICILSANRDERIWPDPDRFDIHREVAPHLAFGKGVHVCLGAWVAKAEVAAVGLPELFGRFSGLALREQDPAEIAGWVFRGMTKLPVTWDAVTAGSAPRAAAAVEAAPERAARITIVGAGPSGCFTAQAVRRALPNARIDLIDEQPVPFGLVRYGVAADHQGTKSVARQFERVFDDPDVRFHGNVRVAADGSGDATLEQLAACSDAVVVATGLAGDRVPEIPGIDTPGVRCAGELTRRLNGHPDAPPAEPLGRSAAIIGHGNVAMDLARLTARRDFTGSDIDDAAHERLAQGLRELHLIGRSAPDEAKFDPVMVRELASLPGVAHTVHGVDFGAAPVGKHARLDAIRDLAEQPDPASPTLRVEWWFGARPVEVLGGDSVTGVRIATADGERTLGVDAVITATGFAATAAQVAAIPVAAGAHPDGRAGDRRYTAGWLRRGPRGTIPDQRDDARQLARLIAEELAPTLRGTADPGGFTPPAHAVDFTGWRRIDVLERLGAAPGRVRAKLPSRAEQVAAAGRTDLELPPAPAHRGSAHAWERPVTILFATESGGAELASEDLRRQFAPGADVRVLDASETEPHDLDPDRLHLVLCSTYGDGELPTGARALHAALLKSELDLAGLAYAVFGMGDRSYAHTYSRGSELLDAALAERGAQRVGEYGRHDAGGSTDASDAAVEWLEGVLGAVDEQGSPAHDPARVG